MKLKKTIPNYVTNGIFKTLQNLFIAEYEWLANADILDLEYFGNVSGNKTVSPIIDSFIENNVMAGLTNPEILTTQELKNLAKIIEIKYGYQWKKYYDLLSLEYNPIENYSMIEEETPNLTKTTTPNLTTIEQDDVTNINTPNTTKTRTAQNIENIDEKSTKQKVEVNTEAEAKTDIYGFNSSEGVPQNDSTGNNKVTTIANANDNIEHNKHTESGQYIEQDTGSTTDKTQGSKTTTQQGATTEKQTGSRVLTRSGNIGVTTSQQMATSEIELWQWIFFRDVFKDVDEVLTIQIYE